MPARLHAGASLNTGLAICALDVTAFWNRYRALGGTQSFGALLNYLHGDRVWSALEHNVAAHALNQQCAALGLSHPVAYADELANR